MKVIRDIQEFPVLPNAVVTSGTFDGVHKGHQKIIQRLVQVARETNGQSVVITYWPHPRLILNPNDHTLQLLSTIEERINQLAFYEVDYLLIIPFTAEFSNLNSHDYIQDILVNAIRTKILVIGYDHRFGKNREGGFEYLQEQGPAYGFRVEEIPAHDIDHVAVSSTKIRKSLETGNILIANTYLGRQYSLTGYVVRGKQIGRTIGFPTANIEVPEKHKLIPAQGIYAVQILVKGELYGGMLSIGTNPTVGGQHQTIEVNIFDFEDDIYGLEVTIFFVDYLRPEEKYPSLEALTSQLYLDQENALKKLRTPLI